MQKLVLISKGDEFNIYLDDVGIEVEVVPVPKTDRHENLNLKNTSLFLVDDRHVKLFVQKAAQKNPGSEIKVFSLEKVGQCPAGDFVMKDVTKDGILPL